MPYKIINLFLGVNIYFKSKRLFHLFPQLITINNNDLPFEDVTDDHIGVH